MNDRIVPFNKTVYEKSLKEGNQNSFKVISNTILEKFDPESVIDFGCGCGWMEIRQ